MYPGRVLVMVGPPRISIMSSRLVMRLTPCGLDGFDQRLDISLNSQEFGFISLDCLKCCYEYLPGGMVRRQAVINKIFKRYSRYLLLFMMISNLKGQKLIAHSYEE